MKSIKILLVSVCALFLFSMCKKDSEDNNNSETTIAKMVTVFNLHDSAAVKYKEVFLATGDSLEALIGMANWCLQQPEVEIVYLIDHSIVNVHFKNGLITPMTVIPVDAAGIHLVRGAGMGELTKFSSNKTIAADEHLIGNNKVMIFIPYLGQFYGPTYPFLPKFSGGKQKLEPTLLLAEAADLAAISTFADYGFIIINSHGETEGFCILTKIRYFDEPWEPGRTPFTEEQLKAMMAQANNLPFDKVENGELKISFKIYQKEGVAGNTIECSNEVLVTDSYIRKLPRLNKTVVFGNHCYSGYSYAGESTKNLPEAWESIGAISYYGYAFADGKSSTVGNDFCVQMEDSLITNLLYELDSTGKAHLANNSVNQFQEGKTKKTGGVAIPPPPSEPGVAMAFVGVKYSEDYPPIPMDFYFEHFNDVRYKYKPCGDTITDMRDQQQYPTVCIGDQVWMAKNLNYAGAGKCFDNNPANCAIYGRLYSIDEATGRIASDSVPSGVRGICPQGWHVPSLEEWNELLNFVGASNVSEMLFSPDGWSPPNTNAKNILELGLKPGGYHAVSQVSETFQFIGQYGYYWTTHRHPTNSNLYETYNITENGMLAGGYYTQDQTISWYFSCRCVKD